MKHSFYFFILILCSACIQAPDFPIEPVITYQGLSNFEMSQGSASGDSIKLFFGFTDGDGDLGVPSSQIGMSEFDIVVTDMRTNQVQDNSFLPFVPPKGASNGIQGTGELLILTTCCLFEDGTPPCETSADTPTNDLQYEIFIRDRAGNESNRIMTPVIRLICD